MPSINRYINASLSSMWAINDHPDLNEFFRCTSELGFEQVELNHQVDSTMLSIVNLDHIQFSSIHEPCPADIPAKQLVERDWLISSADETSRQRGVEAVKKSIYLAHQLGAPVVVIHSGNASTDSRLETHLRQLFEHEQSHTDEYRNIQLQFMQMRAGLVPPHLEAAKKSLSELLDYSSQYGVKLGLENRYHYLDIPSIEEMDAFLQLAAPDELGFIYDVGHAQALDRLGFYPNEEWLERFSRRMFGAHLHDVRGVHDHLSPGLGEINFKKIAPFLPDGAFRTLELQPGNTLAQIRSGIDILLDAGCIRYL